MKRAKREERTLPMTGDGAPASVAEPLPLGTATGTNRSVAAERLPPVV